MSWYYEQPVKIVFGNGSLSELETVLEQCEITKPFYVIGKHVLQYDNQERISQLLKKGSGFFSEISPNPDVTEVDACVLQVKKSNANGIVAIGGGSVLDLAKAVAIVSNSIYSVDAILESRELLPTESLPLVAVPTTAGTGSEVTNIAVLSNRAKGTKKPLASPNMYPSVAIVDPQLTVSMSKQLTAQTGIDVLCHALEAYWSIHHQTITDIFAIKAAHIVLKYLPIVISSPEDTKAREKMSEAALIAGLAFNIPKTSGPHACSFPLTNHFGIAHGEACGLTLDWFLLFNYNGDGKTKQRLDQLAQALDLENGVALAREIFKLKENCGLKTNLRDYNLSETEVAVIIEESLKHPNIKINPVEITKKDLRELMLSIQSNT